MICAPGAVRCVGVCAVVCVMLCGVMCVCSVVGIQGGRRVSGSRTRSQPALCLSLSLSLSLSLRYYSRGVGVCEAYNFQNLLPKTPNIFRLRRALALRAPLRPNTLMTELGAIIKHLILEPLSLYITICLYKRDRTTRNTLSVRLKPCPHGKVEGGAAQLQGCWIE